MSPAPLLTKYKLIYLYQVKINQTLLYIWLKVVLSTWLDEGEINELVSTAIVNVVKCSIIAMVNVISGTLT